MTDDALPADLAAPDAGLDAFGQATLDTTGRSASVSTNVDGTPAPTTRKYPPFRVEEWRDNNYARMVNKVVDKFTGLDAGTSAECEVGEAYVYAFTCYAGSARENMPPWLIAVVATVSLAFAWWNQRSEKQRAETTDMNTEVDELQAKMAAARGANPTEKV